MVTAATIYMSLLGRKDGSVAQASMQRTADLIAA